MSEDDSESPAQSTVMTSAELCAYLKIHRSTLYRLLKTGEIPCFRIGSDYRFNRDAIDRWRRLQERDVAGHPAPLADESAPGPYDARLGEGPSWSWSS